MTNLTANVSVLEKEIEKRWNNFVGKAVKQRVRIQKIAPSLEIILELSSYIKLILTIQWT